MTTYEQRQQCPLHRNGVALHGEVMGGKYANAGIRRIYPKTY